MATLKAKKMATFSSPVSIDVPKTGQGGGGSRPPAYGGAVTDPVTVLPITASVCVGFGWAWRSA